MRVDQEFLRQFLRQDFPLAHQQVKRAENSPTRARLQPVDALRQKVAQVDVQDGGKGQRNRAICPQIYELRCGWSANFRPFQAALHFQRPKVLEASDKTGIRIRCLCCGNHPNACHAKRKWVAHQSKFPHRFYRDDLDHPRDEAVCSCLIRMIQALQPIHQDERSGPHQ